MNKIATILSLTLWWTMVFVICALAVGMVVSSYADGATYKPDPCYSRAQARERYPNQVIYWRTQYRCWGIMPPGRPLHVAPRKQWYVVIPLEQDDPMNRPMQTWIIPETPAFFPWDNRFK
jgi:hypothetical protein